MESLTHNVKDYLAECRRAGKEPDWALLRFFNDMDRFSAQPLPESLYHSPRWMELIGQPPNPDLVPLWQEAQDYPWWEYTGWRRWWKRLRQWSV